MNHSLIIIKFLYGPLNVCCIHKRYKVWEMIYSRYENVTLTLSLSCTSLFISWLCWKKIFEKSHKSHARVIFKDHFYCIFSARSRTRNLIQERGLNNVNLMQWKYPESSINICTVRQNLLLLLWTSSWDCGSMLLTQGRQRFALSSTQLVFFSISIQINQLISNWNSFLFFFC